MEDEGDINLVTRAVQGEILSWKFSTIKSLKMRFPCILPVSHSNFPFPKFFRTLWESHRETQRTWSQHHLGDLRIYPGLSYPSGFAFRRVQAEDFSCKQGLVHL